MLAKFWTRFTVAVFAGAAFGLLVGVLANVVFDAGWNPFAGMSWGIMAASLFLSFRYAVASETTKKRDDA